MTDFTYYKFETREGLPPAGEPGFFFGFCAAGRPYVLWWQPEQKCWGFVGPSKGGRPMAYLAQDEMADFIKRWAFAPATEEDWSEPSPTQPQTVE